MIAVIRVRGLVGKGREVEETFNRLNLRKKFVCIILRETPETMGMVRKVDNFIAYGEIDKSTLVELIKKRGASLDKKKIDAEKIATEFMEAKTEKKFSDFGIKNFFRLHPPRGGIELKARFPKGDLGKHDKINELIRRML